MSITSFKDARRENCEAGPFLDVDHFAETLTFAPASGDEPRELAGKVSEDTSSAPPLEDGSAEDLEVIWVKVCRNEECAKGGIASPAMGDSLSREDDDRPYSYQGDVRHVTPHSWELRFARAKPHQYTGPGGRSRR